MKKNNTMYRYIEGKPMTEEQKLHKIQALTEILCTTNVIGRVFIIFAETVDISYCVPIDVKILSIDRSNGTLYVTTTERTYFKIEDTAYTIEEYKPYLRPLSDMTSKEKEEFDELESIYDFSDYFLEMAQKEWYIKHHFDCHHLIENDWAIAVPKDMYKI